MVGGGTNGRNSDQHHFLQLVKILSHTHTQKYRERERKSAASGMFSSSSQPRVPRRRWFHRELNRIASQQRRLLISTYEDVLCLSADRKNDRSSQSPFEIQTNNQFDPRMRTFLPVSSRGRGEDPCGAWNRMNTDGRYGHNAFLFCTLLINFTVILLYFLLKQEKQS